MTANGGEIEKNQYLRMQDDLNTAVRLVEKLYYDNKIVIQFDRPVRLV